ncbi:MAG TPA: hypothetical protein VGP83_17090 [Pyrinomonadaceae bacterium]|jgi:hypothetical protein|nr:hypothetical protein [Pyrinomonadaceae bacterium]
MTKTEYAEYLQSEHWKRLRREAITDCPECFRCGIPRDLAREIYDQDLHVHHKRYNLWREDLSDLEVLCRRCHDIETHGGTRIRQAPGYPAPDLRQVISEPPCEVVVYRSGFGHPVIRQAAGVGELEDARIYLRQGDLPRLIRALVALERGRAE